MSGFLKRGRELHAYRKGGSLVGSAYEWPDGSWIVCMGGTREDVADEAAARRKLVGNGAGQEILDRELVNRQ